MLADQWTEVHAAEENELERHSKSYPKTNGDEATEDNPSEVKDDNYMPPSEDEASLDDDEFVVPEDPVKQERFKHRLMATAISLKKKQQQLRADQD